MKKTAKKLALNKESIRNLSDQDLTTIRGGAVDPSRRETFCDSTGTKCQTTGLHTCAC